MDAALYSCVDDPDVPHVHHRDLLKAHVFKEVIISIFFNY